MGLFKQVEVGGGGMQEHLANVPFTFSAVFLIILSYNLDCGHRLTLFQFAMVVRKNRKLCNQIANKMQNHEHVLYIYIYTLILKKASPFYKFV